MISSADLLVPSIADHGYAIHFPAGLQQKRAVLLQCYIAGKTTKQIMEELNIKENTLKFHNKNLYGKLGVNSRKQLLEICKFLENNP